MNKFTERNKLNLSDVNKEVLNDWDAQDVFHRSMTEREGCPSFIFFEGPPSANGHPGIHHVMARSLKDTFCRYKTMKGYKVARKAGWDTHGLPVELGVEKELGITKEDIGKSISIEEYNQRCRTNVMKFTSEWAELSHTMGYWVDLEHPYITYDNKYIESLWWLLKQLYTKKLLYKGYTIQPYSPAAGTGLSSHELNQPGCYRDVKDTTVTALFKIEPRLGFRYDELKDAYFAAWTTTPWTLPSNSALCVGPNIDYVLVQTFNPYSGALLKVVMAEARLSAYLSPEGVEASMEDYTLGDKIIPYRILNHYKGQDLVGTPYRQLLNWVKPIQGRENVFRVIPGDYVTTEDGTGIVHIAPNFGADDQMVAKKAGINAIVVLNKYGEYKPLVAPTGRLFRMREMDPDFVDEYMNIEEYKKYSGKYVRNEYIKEGEEPQEDLNVTICMDLKQRGLAFKIAKHVHNYPHCWRTDKPILYYPLDSWFIRASVARQRMSKLNDSILWKPASTGTGRFGKWLENLNDWNLSRSRYWGTPLPIWRNKETQEEICIGSLEELYDEIEKSVAKKIMASNPLKEKGFVPGDMSQENYDKIDLHRPYVDNIKLVSDRGNILTREADLIDVWFDSGSMPYAQIHYPFENKELLDSGQVYPADFIAEGVDQTRGWFYTLHAIATMVFDSVAYKAVISNGLVLDKNGMKMSKRLGNSINPFDCIEKYGADAVRWYMLTNSQPWDNLRFDEDGVAEVSRTFFGKLFQTYSFLAMYANVDNFDYRVKAIPLSERPEIDRWVISELNTLIKAVDESLNSYEPTRAGRLIQNFVVDNLSNWYVRLNRKRFWGGGMTNDKLSAYQTLYTCLETISRLIAPIAPFYADRLYSDLHVLDDTKTSVHLVAFPQYDEALIDSELECSMELAQQITSMVLSLRKKEQIIVRQPLQCISIPVTDSRQKSYIEKMQQLILDEVNVKELQFVEGSGVMVKKVKCNFRVMGKKFGKMMKSVADEVGKLSQEQISTLEKNGTLEVEIDGNIITIMLEDVEIISEDIPGWSVAVEGSVTVALDITITPALKDEGIAREIVKRIQAMRKETGLEITDRINVIMSDIPQIAQAVNIHRDYIASQVLSDSITLDNSVNGQEFDFEDFKVNIYIEKV
ncbi:MAG: isoleucine--tRNA ligase [Prevotellaceae bacterium]|nr:isoleucine--tRNA ligase [Candidatus Colivivens equi]